METLGDCGRGGWTLVMKMSGDKVIRLPKETFEESAFKY